MMQVILCGGADDYSFSLHENVILGKQAQVVRYSPFSRGGGGYVSL